MQRDTTWMGEQLVSDVPKVGGNPVHDHGDPTKVTAAKISRSRN
jgi:hypothetical protein